MEGQGDIFQSQAKKKLLEKLLQGEFALVYINPEVQGLKLPPQTGGVPSITLKLSNNFSGSLLLKTQEIEASLLFGDSYEKCIIPYSSIWAIADTVDVVRTWKESIPPVIKPFLVQLGLTPEGDIAKREEATKPTPLSLASDSATPSPKKTTPGPSLRRIK